MTTEQIVLQLGIAGLLILVGGKIALALIERWGKVESERTIALRDGFADMATSIRAGFVRMDHKLDVALAGRPPAADFADEVTTTTEAQPWDDTITPTPVATPNAHQRRAARVVRAAIAKKEGGSG